MSMHQGGCHCGAVRFEADVELTNLATCNCSICGKTGAIMVFLPREKLRVVSGRESLTDYQFGKQTIHHSFCSICGIRCFGEGQDREGNLTAMLNVRCLDDVDVHKLDIAQKYDGKSF